MYKTPLILALSFLFSACTAGTTLPEATSTPYSPPSIKTPAQTWISLDIGSGIESTLSAETLTQHVITQLSEHEPQILGADSPEPSQVESGCKEPVCFEHLRQTMSIHRVVRIYIRSHNKNWHTEVHVFDLAYGKTLASVTKTLKGNKDELFASLDAMIHTAYQKY